MSILKRRTICSLRSSQWLWKINKESDIIPRSRIVDRSERAVLNSAQRNGSLSRKNNFRIKVGAISGEYRVSISKNEPMQPTKNALLFGYARTTYKLDFYLAEKRTTCYEIER